MRTFVCMTIVALATTIAPPAGASPAPTTGLRGIVWRGPVQPVCQEGVPCDRPAKGVTLVFSRDGREFGRATSGPAGRYTIRLLRGIYTVRTAARKLGVGGMAPRSVRVVAGRMTRVDFHIDTGIR